MEFGRRILTISLSRHADLGSLIRRRVLLAMPEPFYRHRGGATRLACPAKDR